MAQWTFYNNGFVLEKECTIPAGDLAVQRGYGIFDFLRTAEGFPLLLDEHLSRFYRSAETMRLPVGKTTVELKRIVNQLMQKNNLPHSGIRLTLTGGLSTDGFSIAAPNLIITEQVITPPSTVASGIRLATFEYQRQLPHVKTIDYLMAIWLQPWLAQQGADDVLYHWNGTITECPRANFFIVAADGTIATAAKNVLSGITRARLLRLPGTMEREITKRELTTAREAFITSTTKQVLPVVVIDGISIGDGKPGPVTQHLAEQLAAELIQIA